MYRKKAAQLLREGNRAEARECLQRCIDISPEMALRLMEVIIFWQPSKLLLLIYILCSVKLFTFNSSPIKQLG